MKRWIWILLLFALLAPPIKTLTAGDKCTTSESNMLQLVMLYSNIAYPLTNYTVYTDTPYNTPNSDYTVEDYLLTAERMLDMGYVRVAFEGTFRAIRLLAAENKELRSELHRLKAT